MHAAISPVRLAAANDVPFHSAQPQNSCSAPPSSSTISLTYELTTPTPRAKRLTHGRLGLKAAAFPSPSTAPTATTPGSAAGHTGDLLVTPCTMPSMSPWLPAEA